jgi:glyoxylase-like metal-dependent hydrolase (beta-lactamase superfamily II)
MTMKKINVEQLAGNPFMENTYVLYDDTRECVIIDPGNSNSKEDMALSEVINRLQLKPVRLLNTHCHIDHILGNQFVANTWGLTLEACQEDEYNLDMDEMVSAKYGIFYRKSPRIGRYINAQDKVQFGNSELEILFTPGHTAGSISFYNSENHILISGDVLFEQSIGRTDLPGGDFDTLINTIKNQLFVLPDETIVYSGHGNPTTIGRERISNPFLT